MTTDPGSTEPATNPDADEDPLTETPKGTPGGAPPDNPSGSRDEDVNEGQGDDVASGGS